MFTRLQTEVCVTYACIIRADILDTGRVRVVSRESYDRNEDRYTRYPGKQWHDDSAKRF